MQITCPNCALQFPLVAGMNDADARRVAALMGELPPKLAPLVIEYLQMFKPPKSGLTWKRTYTLLSELVPVIKAGQINRNGRAWAAPSEHWQSAIQEMIGRRHKFTLPLKSHGYLYEILVGLTDKSEAALEKLTEERRRNSPDRSGSKSTDELKSELKSIQTLINASPNEAVRQALQKQAQGIEDQLHNKGVT